MNEPSIKKIECPSCGQRYSVELTDEEQDITCQVCKAVFTAARIGDDAPPPITQTVKPQRTIRTPAHTRPTLSNQLKPARSGSLLDRFMGLLFRFGKTFAGILAVLCLLSVVVSIGVFILNLRTSMEIPSYDEISSSVSEEDPDAPGSTAALDERRAIEKKFGDRVYAIIKEHKVLQYDQLVQMIRTIDEDNRSKYMKGLESALEDRDAATRNSKGEILSVEDVADRYHYFFFRAQAAHEAEKQKAKAKRMASLGSVVISCFMLFMMLIIPALLRIEENTRKPA